ncbi:MAG: hypothetical protein RMH84_00970 [Sulfolobales archaeon]|nr:hypothetical protein [Sulfolobales archaeon]MDW8010157.1 hypothetical protein [Sulfolobales archaeon]
MSSSRARLCKQFGYVYLELPLENALRVLRYLRERRGASEDIDDSIRILENFDAFYEYSRRKFKEYLAPKKNEADLLSGRVTVDKVKLELDGEKRVTIVFDKRVKVEAVVEALKNLGLEFELP